MATSFPPRLGPTDSVMWAIESDPVLRSPILVVAVLDQEPDTARVRAAFERAVEIVPRLHQRIRPSRLRPGHVWEEDPSFSLDHHLRRVRAPHPASMRTVLDMAQPILSHSFDRERALWEAHLVGGIEEGRAALVLKIHHSATDGVGGVDLAGALFDLTRDGAHDEGEEISPMPPSRLHRLAAEATGVARRSQQLVSTAARAVSEPLGFARDSVRAAMSLEHLLEPIRAPLSPVMRGRGLTHHLDVLEIPMEELERAAHAAGGTVNDALLAAVAHGLGRYHQRHGRPSPSLRITMPVNLRRAGDPKGGNRFAPVRFEIPTDVSDPGDRIRRLGDLAHRWRDDPAMAWTETIAAGIRVLPPTIAAATLGSMFKAVDVDVVDVPGVPVPIWLAGAGVERLYAFAPPTGAALSITLLSHAGTACIGIETNDVAIPDPDAMRECLVEGFDTSMKVDTMGS
ncbi:MAG: wax ester/triacylglycerol synthase family O-acyltransferase [Acidimicrobiales bacterium]|nr:wax ester/triacylglycerol synthase family O-acyltransferase [Acidimicrobiales bacterium]